MKKIIVFLIIKICFADWLLLDSVSIRIRNPAGLFLAVKFDLADNLNKLDSVSQDQYAQMILNAQNPFIDEIAFQVARIPYNILI